MFCLLVVLAKLSLLAKWLARKTPLKKPNCGEGIISIKPRPKSAHDFLGLLYCFIVLLCICVVSCSYVIYYPTVMARYSLFVLKVPLNPKQTNKQYLTSTSQLLLLSQHQQYSQPVHDKRGHHQTTSTVFAVFLSTLTCSCRKAKTMFLPMKSSSIGLFLITYLPTWDFFRFSFSRSNGIYIIIIIVC